MPTLRILPKHLKPVLQTSSSAQKRSNANNTLPTSQVHTDFQSRPQQKKRILKVVLQATRDLLGRRHRRANDASNSQTMEDINHVSKSQVAEAAIADPCPEIVPRSGHTEIKDSKVTSPLSKALTPDNSTAAGTSSPAEQEAAAHNSSPNMSRVFRCSSSTPGNSPIQVSAPLEAKIQTFVRSASEPARKVRLISIRARANLSKFELTTPQFTASARSRRSAQLSSTSAAVPAKLSSPRATSGSICIVRHRAGTGTAAPSRPARSRSSASLEDLYGRKPEFESRSMHDDAQAKDPGETSTDTPRLPSTIAIEINGYGDTITLPKKCPPRIHNAQAPQRPARGLESLFANHSVLGNLPDSSLRAHPSHRAGSRKRPHAEIAGESFQRTGPTGNDIGHDSKDSPAVELEEGHIHQSDAAAHQQQRPTGQEKPGARPLGQQKRPKQDQTTAGKRQAPIHNQPVLPAVAIKYQREYRAAGPNDTDYQPLFAGTTEEAHWLLVTPRHVEEVEVLPNRLPFRPRNGSPDGHLTTKSANTSVPHYCVREGSLDHVSRVDKLNSFQELGLERLAPIYCHSNRAVAPAREIGTNRVFILKTTRLQANERRKAQPLEYQMLNKVQFRHRNFVELFGALYNANGGVPEWTVIVEHCSGGDLRDFLSHWQGKMGLRIPEMFIAHFMSSIGQALGFLHHGLRYRDSNTWHMAIPDVYHNKALAETPMLHRDLKPENIFLRWGPSNRYGMPDIVVGDFDLAQPESGLNDWGGTPSYYPPEVRFAQELERVDADAFYELDRKHRWMTAASDIYCFGICAFRLVTKIDAFPQSLYGVEKMLEVMYPGTQSPLSRVIIACLREFPAERISSRYLFHLAGEWEHDLARDYALGVRMPDDAYSPGRGPLSQIVPPAPDPARDDMSNSGPNIQSQAAPNAVPPPALQEQGGAQPVVPPRNQEVSHRGDAPSSQKACMPDPQPFAATVRPPHAARPRPQPGVFRCPGSMSTVGSHS